MKKRFQNSQHNRCSYYKIHVDSFAAGGPKNKRLFRSKWNPKDWNILKGKEFFNDEKMNNYQKRVKRKIQRKHGKYFYLRDLYNQYD